MAYPVILPRQGQSVESCIITDIFKNVGDTIEKGEPLFAYETDKASFEAEAEEAGEILAILVNVGDEVPVLSNIAVIGKKGEPIEDFITKPAETDEISNDVTEQTSQQLSGRTDDSYTVDKISDESHVHSFISPRAKKLAEEKGTPISAIKGTGPQGRIIERDILLYLENNPKLTPLANKKAAEENLTAPDKGSGLGGTVRAEDLKKSGPVSTDDFKLEPLSNIRKLIAGAMFRSLQNSAQLTHHLGADARKILALRKKVKAALDDGYQYNITINDMVCYAVIQTLQKHLKVNSHLLDDHIKIFNKVHLGFAVDTDRGLMVPAIKNADALSIQSFSEHSKNIADSCKRGNIDPDILSAEAASFTVSNLGNYGVEMFTPIINLPQVAILGVNTIVPRPVNLEDEKYDFIPYLGLSITYDHRALDGGEASRFLKDLATEIENMDFKI